MKLTVVGCSGSFPGPDSSASCYLLEADGFKLLLDLGNGALGPLARYTSIYEIDAVLVSHLHADHFFDICSLFVARNYHPELNLPRIPVLGPPGLSDRLSGAYGLPAEPGMSDAFDFHLWEDGGIAQVGPFTVTVTNVVHPMGAVAMRVEQDGRALAYSGDSSPCDPLVEIARDSDLFLCEAGWLEGEDNPPGIHLTGKEAAEHAVRAAAKRLVLTHIPPWHDPERALAEAAAVYGDGVEVARPGGTFDL
jgi:ribonuclease BN (tRNA processing enzyme)